MKLKHLSCSFITALITSGLMVGLSACNTGNGVNGTQPYNAGNPTGADPNGAGAPQGSAAGGTAGTTPGGTDPTRDPGARAAEPGNAPISPGTPGTKAGK